MNALLIIVAAAFTEGRSAHASVHPEDPARRLRAHLRTRRRRPEVSAAHNNRPDRPNTPAPWRSGPAPGQSREGSRSTRQRQAVMRLLRDCPDFVSARTLHAAAESAGVAVGLTTVYRTLHLLESTGCVDVVRDRNGERLYRPRPEEGHRHYVVCRACGLSLAVESEQVERWAADTAAKTGFAEVHHTVELTGVCADCNQSRRGK
ncbi:Fur family transcriptional regulator [Streptomyces sp. SID9124]|uniref:transcriptional repressor n=1 Tax=Streptomyces sp. SID9124 TaxID=2706108 RepID=UPI0013E008AF|nr:transcriptional repressor [Streptomyces sp. SID9124]